MRPTLVLAALVATSVSPAWGAATALMKTAPAKGTRECLIEQHSSEFLSALYEEAKAKAGVPFYMKTSSYLKFRVARSGALTVSIAEDTKPGSTFYFMISGKRYSGQERYRLPLDASAIAALRQDKTIDFTYTGWPYGNEMSRKDVFSGFGKAYDECRSFLNNG